MKIRMKIVGLGLIFLSALTMSCMYNNTKAENSQVSVKSENMNQMNSTQSIYDIKINKLDGSPLELSSLKGKKIMFVNVASKCGYTPQYAELQELYDKFKDKLEIIGVPCNQFGGQEPGDADEIAQFCQKNYGVTFTMAEKVDVKGASQHPLYTWLTSKELNGVMDAKVKWNFHKFLVDEEGQLINMYGSGTNPLGTEIVDAISK